MSSEQAFKDQLMVEARVGELFTEFIASKYWSLFKEHILDVMDREAYEGYLSEDPTKEEENRQLKLIGRIVRDIPIRVNKKIENGKLSLQRLLELNDDITQEEDM